MEGAGTIEQDFDEIEILLGEIPNATSHAEHIIPAYTSSAFETISIEEKNETISSSSKFTNLYNSPRSMKNGENMTYFGSLAFPVISVDQNYRVSGKIDDRSNGYKTCTLDGERERSNLPFEISLASAFEGLSFKDNAEPKRANPSLITCNLISPNHASLNNSQTLFGRDTSEASNLSMNTVKIDSQGNVNSHGYNGAMPLNPRAYACDLLQNVAVQGSELRTSPYQQRIMDAQAPTFMLPRHLGQFSTDEEMYYRLRQQYLCQQQLHSQISELVQFQKNTNSSESSVPPYYEVPSNPNFYWHDNVVHSGNPQFDLSAMGTGFCHYHPRNSCGRVRSCEFPCKHQVCNAQNFLEHQFLDRIGQYYGVNSLRSLRSNSFVNDRSTSISDNQNYCSHGHGHHLAVKNNASLQSQSSSSDGMESIAPRSIQVKYNSVDEVLGRIYYLAKDQHGCRFLQRKFMEGSMENVNKIFREIIGHIVELMTDPFGNYLIQKMLEVCTDDQRMQIILAITKEAGMLMRISCNMHGTRAVQKVVETLCTKEQMYMVLSSLKPGIVPLIKDINGNHVAQRCLQYFSPQQSEVNLLSNKFNINPTLKSLLCMVAKTVLHSAVHVLKQLNYAYIICQGKFLFDAVISHCVEIATDRQGCCVLQKCVYHSHGDQRNRLMSEISSYSLVLSQDPYGNYVVQYVLDQKVPWVIAAVLDRLEGNYEYLSTQKYGSNVVEKCLKLAKEEGRDKIIRELVNSPRFLQILQDAYGNFVIQSALKQCKGALSVALLDAVKAHASALRNHPYGKKVLLSTNLKR